MCNPRPPAHAAQANQMQIMSLKDECNEHVYALVRTLCSLSHALFLSIFPHFTFSECAHHLCIVAFDVLANAPPDTLYFPLATFQLRIVCVHKGKLCTFTFPFPPSQISSKSYHPTTCPAPKGVEQTATLGIRCFHNCACPEKPIYLTFPCTTSGCLRRTKSVCGYILVA